METLVEKEEEKGGKKEKERYDRFLSKFSIFLPIPAEAKDIASRTRILSRKLRSGCLGVGADYRGGRVE